MKKILHLFEMLKVMRFFTIASKLLVDTSYNREVQITPKYLIINILRVIMA